MSSKAIQSIENIKTSRMNEKGLVFLGFGAFFGGIFAWIFQRVAGVLSFEVGFLSFVLVFLSLFWGMRQRLRNISKTQGNTQEKPTFSSKVSLGMGISFSLLRILAYLFLIVALVMLLEFKVFSIYAYMVGIFVGLGLVLLLFYLNFR